MIPTGIIFLSLRISYIIMIMHIALIGEVQYMIMINMLQRLPTGYFFSKIAFALRTLILVMVVKMAGELHHLVALEVWVITMCMIPTGVLYHQEGISFRSPWSTNTNDDSAFCVDSGGSVGINISILVVANSDGRNILSVIHWSDLYIFRV